MWLLASHPAHVQPSPAVWSLSSVNLTTQGPFYQTLTDLQIWNTTSALSMGLFFRNLGLPRKYPSPRPSYRCFLCIILLSRWFTFPRTCPGMSSTTSLSAAPGALSWNSTVCFSKAVARVGAPGIRLCSSPHSVSHRAQISATKSLIHSCLVLRFHLKSTPEADFLFSTYLDRFLACLHVLMLFLIFFTFFLNFIIESLSSMASSLSLSRR